MSPHSAAAAGHTHVVAGLDVLLHVGGHPLHLCSGHALARDVQPSRLHLARAGLQLLLGGTRALVAVQLRGA